MNETAIPQHDYIFVRRVGGSDEMLSKGGIIMPDVEDPTGNKRSSGRLEVVAVGPGAWVDRADPGKETGFARRPPCCKAGDLVIVQGGAFLFNVGGEQLMVIQDYQVCAVIEQHSQEKPS